MAYRANVGVFSVLDLPLAGQDLEFFLVMIQWSYKTKCRFNWKEHFIYFSAFMLLLMNSESMKGQRKEVFKKEAEIQTFL